MDTMSPDRVAVGFGEGTESDVFGTVVITTHEGHEYVFPSMNVTKLKSILPESGRVETTMPALVMVNTSVSALTVPMRIIRSVTVDTEELWSARGPDAREGRADM